ncbi:MAG TPA: GAF domain-containing protein [Burkholderiales bacterium]
MKARNPEKLRRALKERDEALAFQAATDEILTAISRSSSDAKPVFDAIVRCVPRLFATRYVAVFLVKGNELHLAASKGDVQYERRRAAVFRRFRDSFPQPIDWKGFTGRALRSGKVSQIAPIIGNPKATPQAVQLAKEFGYNAMLVAPLVRDGKAIGAIGTTRPEAKLFDARELALFKRFAAQAFIAIENARLFNETKEALERQTATAEVLQIISRSTFDLQVVLHTLVQSVARLCQADHAWLFRREGDGFRWAASFGHSAEDHARIKNYMLAQEVMPSRKSLVGRTALEGRPVQIVDVQADPEYQWSEAQVVGHYRTTFGVPLKRGGETIGVLALTRSQVQPFSENQMDLCQVFADQAVIAIENVRLFNETKEALERQTATADILRVISSSPTNIQPVLEAVAATAARLCEAKDAIIQLRDGDVLRFVAHHGKLFNIGLGDTRTLSRELVAGRAVLEGRQIHVHDLQAEANEYPRGSEIAREFGYRTILGTPLLREGVAIGSIIIRRAEARPFTETQLALMRTFADQAVIAIENVRLFKELQERTEALTRSVDQLTALGDVGQAISSTLDLETVLKTIVSRAVQLTGLDAGAIYEYDERTEQFQLRAAENIGEDVLEVLRSTPIRKGDGAVGGTALAREPIQVHETQDEGYKSRFRDLIIRTGRRALLAVPLMREDHIVGALAVQRNTPGPFAPEVVDLLKTFATQSALAIQNARLFREIAEKGRQLEVASHHKSQFLASMSHELRTPLNALLGFNEMILGDVYGEVPGDMKPPLAQMQASGRHLLRLINNVLDLAKIEAGRMELALSDYSVHDTVESVRSTLRSLAADKGLELLAAVPEDIPLGYGDAGRITQCLMNLAGNSLKFTKAGKVEISVALADGRLRYCVADTGIGIPADKIDSLFTEFKQTDATIASEYGGTGLGLSITKKFIEMHDGRIWVESVPGRGSRFSFEIPLRVQEAKAA